MKKKFLIVISIVLVICQLLPVSTGAVDTLDVYPILYFPLELNDQTNDNDNRNQAIYQTTSEATTIQYNSNGYVNTDNHTGEYGVMFPINHTSNLTGFPETYIINFTMQLKPKSTRNLDPDLSLALPNSYRNYGFDDESVLKSSLSSNDVYTISSSGIKVFYKAIYVPQSDIADSSVNEFGFGVYNLHFTIRVVLYDNTNLRNIFLPIDFYEFSRRYPEMDIIIQPCTTTSYVVTDLDDIDGELDVLNTQLMEIYILLDQMNQTSTSSGSSTTQILNDILKQDKVGYNEIKQATESLKQQVEEMQESMDEKVEQGLENFKENIKAEVKAEVDNAIQDILDKVDVVDTSAAENSFSTLYSVITTDSKDAVLNVPEFRLSLYGKEYVLWESFEFDIPKLVNQMGADQYLIWFRFTFYFGFGWFLYGRANRMISIILLDDVHEQQANIRSQQQEYWKRKNGKR